MGARERKTTPTTRTRVGRVGAPWLSLAVLGVALTGCPERGDDDDSAAVDASCERYCLRMEEPLSAYIESEGCVGAEAQEATWIDVYGQDCSLNPAEYQAVCAGAPPTSSCRTCTLWFEDVLDLRDTLEVVTTCYMHYNEYPEEYDPAECEQACSNAGLEF